MNKALERELKRYFYERYDDIRKDGRDIETQNTGIHKLLQEYQLDEHKVDEVTGRILLLSSLNELQGFINGYEYALIMAGRTT